MAYPKPLSKKKLDSLYLQSGLKEKQIEFLHQFFQACVNLYGAIELQDVWTIYPQIRDTCPKIMKKDIITFSSIVRREEQPYYVFEIEELYSEEPHRDSQRHLVSKELVGSGYGKFVWFYDLMENLSPHPYYIPDDFLSYASPDTEPAQKELLSFLENLWSTEKQCVPPYGKPYPNQNKGKRLKEFSFLSSGEKFDLSYYSKKPAIINEIMQMNQCSAAEKLCRKFCFRENVNCLDTTKLIGFIFEDLREMGVLLTEQQSEKLLQLLVNVHNHCRKWCMCGWSPSDLASKSRPQINTISFGSGLKKAFEDGSIDKNELIDSLIKQGFRIDESGE